MNHHERVDPVERTDAVNPADDVGDGFGPSRSRRIAIRVGMLGPAFVAAVAYVDPGNVAANLQAGSRYGYLLI